MAFAFEIAPAKLVVIVEFLATFFIFEKQVAVFVSEDRVVWRDYEFVKGLLHLTQKINVSLAIKVALRFFIDLTIELVKVGFLRFLAARRFADFIQLFVLMDGCFEIKSHSFLNWSPL